MTLQCKPLAVYTKYIVNLKHCHSHNDPGPPLTILALLTLNGIDRDRGRDDCLLPFFRQRHAAQVRLFNYIIIGQPARSIMYYSYSKFECAQPFSRCARSCLPAARRYSSGDGTSLRPHGSPRLPGIPTGSGNSREFPGNPDP